MKEVNFVGSLHTSTIRDYFARMNSDKPQCMRVAKQFGMDYWDGDRKYGYGGYKYDGRWKIVAKNIIEYYELKDGDKICDIGCGKGHLLYEIKKLNHNLFVHGYDISEYAIINPPVGMEFCLFKYGAEDRRTGFCDKFYDLTYSINVFHNLCYFDLKQAIREMVRVSKEKSYICVESYRTEEELCNLQCWALTCKSFYSPDDWKNILSDNGYSGDMEFIFFS